MNKIQISVIMSVKDGDQWLTSCVKSVLSQTVSNFEFLIVDDASTDRTSQILSTFKEKDKRIKIFTNSFNKGLAVNLNFLICAARGDYIVRMDADDLSLPRRFEVQLSYMEKNKFIGICFSKVNIITENNEFLCVKYSPKNVNTCIWLMPYINYFVHPTAFVRRDVYLEGGTYNEEFLKGQDWELWQRFISKKIRFGIVKDVLLDYRLLIDSSSASLSSSSSHGISYFKAIVLIRNGFKLRSVNLINKIPKKMIFKLFLNLCAPQCLVTLAIILNSKYNNNSPARILLK